jgi:hypothetical protein
MEGKASAIEKGCGARSKTSGKSASAGFAADQTKTVLRLTE